MDVRRQEDLVQTFNVSSIISENTADNGDSHCDECLPLSHPNPLCHGGRKLSRFLRMSQF